MTARSRLDRGCGEVKRGEDVKQLISSLGTERVIEVSRAPVDEGEDGQTVAWREAKRHRAGSCWNGSNDERKMNLIVKEECGVERGLQAVKGRVTVRAEPGLGVEVIHGDEVPLATSLTGEPVVAAESPRHIQKSVQGQIPGPGEGIDQLLVAKTYWERLHST